MKWAWCISDASSQTKEMKQVYDLHGVIHPEEWRLCIQKFETVSILVHMLKCFWMFWTFPERFLNSKLQSLLPHNFVFIKKWAIASTMGGVPSNLTLPQVNSRNLVPNEDSFRVMVQVFKSPSASTEVELKHKVTNKVLSQHRDRLGYNKIEPQTNIAHNTHQLSWQRPKMRIKHFENGLSLFCSDAGDEFPPPITDDNLVDNSIWWCWSSSNELVFVFKNWGYSWPTSLLRWWNRVSVLLNSNWLYNCIRAETTAEAAKVLVYYQEEDMGASAILTAIENTSPC